MGMECFIQFLDRAALAPVMGLSWTTYLSRYPRRRRAIRELVAFGVDPEPDDQEVSRIIETRTIRWTVERSTPGFYFLSVMAHLDPSIGRRCPTVFLRDFMEMGILEATALEAHEQGLIDDRTFWGVLNLVNVDDSRTWLDIEDDTHLRMRHLRGQEIGVPNVFRYQAVEDVGDGYSCLESKDTNRFRTFVSRAWEENWPVPRLNREAKRTIGIRKKTNPRFRDFRLSQELTEAASDRRTKKPYVYACFR